MATATAPKKQAEKPAHDVTQNRLWVFQSTQHVTVQAEIMSADGRSYKDETPPFPPRQFVRNPCLVYDPETKTRRMIRLLNGYESIFEDEQDTPVKLDKDTIAARKRELMLMDGTLMLNTPIDAAAVSFMLIHDDNADKPQSERISQKPPKFKLLNKEESVADRMNHVKQLDKALELWRKVDEKNWENHRPQMAYLGIQFADKQTNLPLSVDNILLQFRAKAEANPALFIRTFEDKGIELQHMVKNAILNGKIDLEKVKGQAHYGESGALITALDVTRDPVEILAEFAATNKEFKERLAAMQ